MPVNDKILHICSHIGKKSTQIGVFFLCKYQDNDIIVKFAIHYLF